MKFRTTLILLIVAIAIGCYIWFYERTQMPTYERAERGKRIVSIKADDIDTVEIIGDKGRIVCAKDKAGDWLLEQPLKYRADKAQLRSICSRIESLNSERVIKADEVSAKALEEFGLKKPALTARFKSRGRGFGLAIGADTPMGENCYARIEGQTDVHILGNAVRSILDKQANDLRDKSVLELDPKDITKVEITHGGSIVELVQEGGTWRIAKPLQGSGDSDKIGGMLRKINNLRVKAFVDDAPKDLAAYGLAAPEFQVSLWGGTDQASRTLLVGKEAEKNVVYAKRGGLDTVVTIPGDIKNELMVKPEELRDRAITRIAQGTIEEVKIKAGDARIALAKTGEKWEIRDPEKAEADDTQVRELLRAITTLKAQDFAAEKAANLDTYGLGPAAVMEITLKPKDGEAETILLGKKFERAKKQYAKRATGGEVLIVGADAVRACTADPLAFLKRQVLDFNSVDVRKLTIAAAGKPRVVCERGEDKEWMIAEPKKAKASAVAIDTILANLSRLRARDLIARNPKDLKLYGLDTPSLQVSLEVRKGSSTETPGLLIGKKAPQDTYYARLAEGDLVFTIPSYIETNIRKDLAASGAPTPSAPTAEAPSSAVATSGAFTSEDTENIEQN
jgi:hypothetical protein